MFPDASIRSRFDCIGDGLDGAGLSWAKATPAELGAYFYELTHAEFQRAAFVRQFCRSGTATLGLVRRDEFSCSGCPRGLWLGAGRRNCRWIPLTSARKANRRARTFWELYKAPVYRAPRNPHGDDPPTVRWLCAKRGLPELTSCST